MKEYAFGIDLGGTTAKVGLFTTSGALLEKWEVPTDTSNAGEHILENLADALHLLGGNLLLGHLGVDGVGQILEDVLTGVGGIGGDFPLFQQSARGGEQADLGRGAAEVDAECVFFHNSFTPFFCGGRPPVII